MLLLYGLGMLSLLKSFCFVSCSDPGVNRVATCNNAGCILTNRTQCAWSNDRLKCGVYAVLGSHYIEGVVSSVTSYNERAAERHDEFKSGNVTNTWPVRTGIPPKNYRLPQLESLLMTQATINALSIDANIYTITSIIGTACNGDNVYLHTDPAKVVSCVRGIWTVSACPMPETTYINASCALRSKDVVDAVSIVNVKLEWVFLTIPISCMANGCRMIDRSRWAEVSVICTATPWCDTNLFVQVVSSSQIDWNVSPGEVLFMYVQVTIAAFVEHRDSVPDQSVVIISDISDLIDKTGVKNVPECLRSTQGSTMIKLGIMLNMLKGEFAGPYRPFYAAWSGLLDTDYVGQFSRINSTSNDAWVRKILYQIKAPLSEVEGYTVVNELIDYTDVLTLLSCASDKEVFFQPSTNVITDYFNVTEAEIPSVMSYSHLDGVTTMLAGVLGVNVSDIRPKLGKKKIISRKSKMRGTDKGGKKEEGSWALDLSNTTQPTVDYEIGITEKHRAKVDHVKPRSKRDAVDTKVNIKDMIVCVECNSALTSKKVFVLFTSKKHRKKRSAAVLSTQFSAVLADPGMRPGDFRPIQMASFDSYSLIYSLPVVINRKIYVDAYLQDNGGCVYSNYDLGVETRYVTYTTTDVIMKFRDNFACADPNTLVVRYLSASLEQMISFTIDAQPHRKPCYSTDLTSYGPLNNAMVSSGVQSAICYVAQTPNTYVYTVIVAVSSAILALVAVASVFKKLSVWFAAYMVSKIVVKKANAMSVHTIHPESHSAEDISVQFMVMVLLVVVMLYAIKIVVSKKTLRVTSQVISLPRSLCALVVHGLFSKASAMLPDEWKSHTHQQPSDKEGHGMADFVSIPLGAIFISVILTMNRRYKSTIICFAFMTFSVLVPKAYADQIIVPDGEYCINGTAVAAKLPLRPLAESVNLLTSLVLAALSASCFGMLAVFFMLTAISCKASALSTYSIEDKYDFDYAMILLIIVFAFIIVDLVIVKVTLRNITLMAWCIILMTTALLGFQRQLTWDVPLGMMVNLSFLAWFALVDSCIPNLIHDWYCSLNLKVTRRKYTGPTIIAPSNDVSPALISSRHPPAYSLCILLLLFGLASSCDNKVIVISYEAKPISMFTYELEDVINMGVGICAAMISTSLLTGLSIMFFLLKSAQAAQLNGVLSVTDGQVTSCDETTCQALINTDVMIPFGVMDFTLGISYRGSISTNLHVHIDEPTVALTYTSQYYLPVDVQPLSNTYMACDGGAHWADINSGECDIWWNAPSFCPVPQPWKYSECYHAAWSSGRYDLCGCAGCGCFLCSNGGACVKDIYVPGGYTTMYFMDTKSYKATGYVSTDTPAITFNKYPPVPMCMENGVVAGNYYCIGESCCATPPTDINGVLNCKDQLGGPLIILTLPACAPCRTSYYFPFTYQPSKCISPCWYSYPDEDVICSVIGDSVYKPVNLSDITIASGTVSDFNQLMSSSSSNCYKGFYQIIISNLRLTNFMCASSDVYVTDSAGTTKYTGRTPTGQMLTIVDGCCGFSMTAELKSPATASCEVPQCDVPGSTATLVPWSITGTYNFANLTLPGGLMDLTLILPDTSYETNLPTKFMGHLTGYRYYDALPYDQRGCQDRTWIAYPLMPSSQFSCRANGQIDTCVHMESCSWSGCKWNHPAFVDYSEAFTAINFISMNQDRVFQSIQAAGIWASGTCDGYRFTAQGEVASHSTGQAHLILQSKSYTLSILNAKPKIVNITCGDTYAPAVTNGVPYFPFTILAIGTKGSVWLNLDSVNYNILVTPGLKQYGVLITHSYGLYITASIGNITCVSSVYYSSNPKEGGFQYMLSQTTNLTTGGGGFDLGSIWSSLGLNFSLAPLGSAIMSGLYSIIAVCVIISVIYLIVKYALPSKKRGILIDERPSIREIPKEGRSRQVRRSPARSRSPRPKTRPPMIKKNK